jgi:hypothetical protein
MSATLDKDINKTLLILENEKCTSNWWNKKPSRDDSIWSELEQTRIWINLGRRKTSRQRE